MPDAPYQIDGLPWHRPELGRVRMTRPYNPGAGVIEAGREFPYVKVSRDGHCYGLVETVGLIQFIRFVPDEFCEVTR